MSTLRLSEKTLRAVVEVLADRQVPVTRDEIAEELGISRRLVEAALAEMRRRGVSFLRGEILSTEGRRRVREVFGDCESFVDSPGPARQ